MHAKTGDWLLVDQHGVDKPSRRGQIVGVRRPDAAPPYVIHWLDSEHEALVYPGPDARVVTAEELAEMDACAAERASAVQRTIGAGGRGT